jgi:hypothetical protein
LLDVASNMLPVGKALGAVKAGLVPGFGPTAQKVATHFLQDAGAVNRVLRDDLSPEAQAFRDQFKVSAFHGTPRTTVGGGEWAAFDPDVSGQIGTHIGTSPAANDIMKDAGPKSMRRIYPLKARIENPLDLPDIPYWGPAEIAGALKDHPAFVSETQQLGNIANMPAPERIKALRQLIESKGYDGIRYVNKVEDPGSTSYITWNPRQLRSPWANFDPAQAQSGNLLAGLAGAGLLPAGLLGARGADSQ